MVALATAGVAIGVAIAYLSDRSSADPSQAAEAPLQPRSTGPEPSRTASASAGRRPTRIRAAAPRTATPTSRAEGHRLNDEGYSLLQSGSYVDAIPSLEKAVADLSGTGPGDPYEAYANYNLGYALLKSGRCSEALAPLETANRLESDLAVDRALREARACTPQGS